MDERMMKTFAEGKVGAVALDADVPGHKCNMIEIDVDRLVDGKWRITPVRGSYWTFGTRMAYGGMNTLPPGEFFVARVNCRFGNRTTRLNGPYAKFQVKVGEVVNLGVLRLDYKTEGLRGDRHAEEVDRRHDAGDAGQDEGAVSAHVSEGGRSAHDDGRAGGGGHQAAVDANRCRAIGRR